MLCLIYRQLLAELDSAAPEKNSGSTDASPKEPYYLKTSLEPYMAVFKKFVEDLQKEWSKGPDGKNVIHS